MDLDEWTGAGHRAIVLDDLERPIALELLRAWGVKGHGAALAKLIEPLNLGGVYHALSVAVLGSYFGNFPAAKAFSIEDASDADPKARRLTRILEQYANALTPVERDLLARLSLFPRGVKVELLGWVAQSGKRVAGALIGLKDQQLVNHLERLKDLGLVFRYLTAGQAVYSAHPFLREFFRDLLGKTKPEAVHESIRARLAPSLEARPSTKPREPSVLDQYELLIEQTLLSGRVQEAYYLYGYGMGGFKNLGWSLGESARGLRVLQRFDGSDDFHRLAIRQQSALLNELGLFARNLGDLARAREIFRRVRGSFQSALDRENESIVCQNLANTEYLAARFPEALQYSETALSLVDDDERTYRSLAFRARAHFAMGNTPAAIVDFQRGTELRAGPLDGDFGIWEAEFKAFRADEAGACRQTRATLNAAAAADWNDTVCSANALLARLLLPDHPAEAAQHLADARAFATHSGEVELQLRCFHAACELQRHLGDYPQSIAEAEAGILLADTCGFGQFSIDLRLALAETYLAAGDPRKALQNARNALDRSVHPECQYAWGEAAGLQLCGLAHQRLGEIELANQRRTAAAALHARLRQK